jgi:hypothetical protein
MLMTKDRDDLMSSFEREYKHCQLLRENDKALWKVGYFYQDSHVNALFVAYRKGHAIGAMAERELCAKWLDAYDGKGTRRAEAISNGEHATATA